MSFEMDDKVWVCSLDSYTLPRYRGCHGSGIPGAEKMYPVANNMRRSRWQGYFTDSVSPDKKWSAVKNGNVVAREIKNNNTFQFTTDGTDDKSFGYLSWSPNGKYIVGYRITPL